MEEQLLPTDHNARAIHAWISNNPDCEEVKALMTMLENFFDQKVDYEGDHATFFRDYKKFLDDEDEELYNDQLLSKFIYPQHPQLYPNHVSYVNV